MHLKKEEKSAADMVHYMHNENFRNNSVPPKWNLIESLGV